MKTIPEIAEDLRAHINNDNAASRLIVEHILPLIGMNFASAEDAANASSYIDYLEQTIVKGSNRLAEIRIKAITLIELAGDLEDELTTLAGHLQEQIENQAINIP